MKQQGRRRRDIKRLARTGMFGLVRGVSTGVGGAIVTLLILWAQNRG
ncbi:hypothetical protein [Streptomyces sp. NPDC057426]